MFVLLIVPSLKDAQWFCLEQLVLIGEQTHDRLSFGNALNRLSNQCGHGELANFFAHLCFFAQGNGVGDHHLIQGVTFGNALNGGS